MRLAVLAIPIIQMAWVNQFTAAYSATKRALATNGIPVVATTSITSKYGAEDEYPSTHYDTIDSYSLAVLSERHIVHQSRPQTLSPSPPPLPNNTYCNATLKLGPIQFTSYPSRHKLSDFLEGPGLSSFVDIDDPNTSKFVMMMKILEEKKKENRGKNQKQHQLVIRGGGRLNISYPIDHQVTGIDTSTSTTTNVDVDANDNDTEEEEAICLYVKSRVNPSHFPHTMQQLYRCWSWWQLNNYDSNDDLPSGRQLTRRRRTRHPVLEFPSEIKHIKDITHDNEFNYGFFKFLKRYANVTIRRSASTSDDGEETLGRKRRSNVTDHRPPRKQHKFVVQPKNFQHSEFPYQSYSPSHFHTLRDIFIKGMTTEPRAATKTTTLAENAPASPPPLISQQPRILILNRNSTRKVLNDQQIRHALYIKMKEHFRQNHSENHATDPYEPNIRSVYFDGNAEMSFQEQIETLYNADILISPHGAALTGIPFLPNCASVLEIFPLGLQFEEFFGSLSAASNVEHSYVYLTNGDTEYEHEKEIQHGMRSGESRAECRAANLCPPIQDSVDAVMSVVRRWEARCVLRKN